MGTLQNPSLDATPATRGNRLTEQYRKIPMPDFQKSYADPGSSPNCRPAPALAEQQQVDADQIRQRIGHPVGVSRIVQMLAQPVDDPEPIHKLTLDQTASFTGQVFRAGLDLNGAVEKML